ncbi:MAG: hypothetical protein KAQ98_14280 [Bacteriovoracaceae bacterium]|nr:hypothetical protein [Bacteriovoracaceae bacterium]
MSKSFLSRDEYFLENMKEVVRSPVEGNLFSYVSNNPLTKIDPTGNFDADVDFKGDSTRNTAGTMSIKDDFGKEVLKVDVLGRGSSRDQLATNADTPTGSYNIGETVDTSSLNQTSWGKQSIKLTPISGKAQQSGRSGLYIHSGKSGTERTGSNYKSLHPKRKDLFPTHGCPRISKADEAKVVNAINKIKESRNTLTYKIKSLIYKAVGAEVNSKDLLHVSN